MANQQDMSSTRQCWGGDDGGGVGGGNTMIHTMTPARARVGTGRETREPCFSTIFLWKGAEGLAHCSGRVRQRRPGRGERESGM